MTVLRIVGGDGEPMFVTWPEDQPWPAGAVAVDRMPNGSGSFEDWSPGEGWHCADPRGRADALAGPVAIAEARLQKRIEAAIVRSGVALDAGLLAAEAAQRGISLTAMAALVTEKAGDFVAAELARQRRQAGEAAP